MLTSALTKPPRILVTIKNYRCFAAPAHVTLELGPRLTALIGPNNAEKSAALRFFYELRSLFASQYKLRMANVHPSGPGYSPPKEVTDIQELFCNANDEDMEIIVETDASDLAPVQLGLEAAEPSVAKKIRFTISRRTGEVVSEVPLGEQWERGPWAQMQPGIVRLQDPARDIVDYRLAASACDAIADTLYVPAFRNLINVGANDSFYDILTGDAFVRNWSNAAGPGLRARNEVVASLQESVEALFRFGRFELVTSTDQRSLQAYIDRKPYKLSELGAGLTQFIMVLFSARLAQRSFVLIDEPETGLHPSLQIDFLTTLADTAKIGTVFSTHSVGLARSVADQTYTVIRSNGRSTLKEFDAQTNVTEFLGEMSYAGSLDLGYRKILLVEGYSEIKAVQQLLRKLRKITRSRSSRLEETR